MPPLSLIIVHQPSLDPQHSALLIQALNAQSTRNFNTFWLDQSPRQTLYSLLQEQADFTWHYCAPPYPVLADVVCWELLQAFEQFMRSPEFGPHWSYLHMECLPDPRFCTQLIELLPELERQYAQDWIGMLYQLRSPLSLQDLLNSTPEVHSARALTELQLRGGQIWATGEPIDALQFEPRAYFSSSWQEDAFVMPTALTRRLKLFSAPLKPLYFQDVFDIFEMLSRYDLGIPLQWLRLTEPRIYHLQHPRAFHELRRPFLDALARQPRHFEHTAWLDLARSDWAYYESQDIRASGWTPPELYRIYERVRYGERGTFTLWFRAVLDAHGIDRLHWEELNSQRSVPDV